MSMPKLEPLKLRDTRPRVYCWHRHGRMVSEWLMANLGADCRVIPVSEPVMLRGLEDATFVVVHDVDSVNDRHSDALADIAAMQGFTILSINDFPKRAARR